MPDNDDLIARLPLGRIAAELGVDGDTATATIRFALPALLTGMKANAEDPAGAASLGKAVGQHPAHTIGGTLNLGVLNPLEGAKIVANVFGHNTEAVIIRLAGSPPVAAVGVAVTRKALNIMAPIVLTYLNQAYVESQRQSPRPEPPPPSTSAVQELLERLIPTATAAASATALATAKTTANATAAVRAATPRSPSERPVREPEPEPAAAKPGFKLPDPTGLAGPATAAAAGAFDAMGSLLGGLLGSGRKT